MLQGILDILFGVLGVFLLILPFVVIIFMFRRNRKKRKKKEDELLKLSPALQQAEKNTSNANMINALTVILPLAIFTTLKREGYDFNFALILSLGVGVFFRLLFSFLSSRKSNK